MPRKRFTKLQAVTDTSFLRCLLLLDLSFPLSKLPGALQLRYEIVHIPQHVWNETARRGHKRSQLQRLLRNYPFFKKCDIGNPYDAQLLYDRRTNPKARIDRGEAEAIIQGRERGVSDILIDERKGTRIARAHNLNVRGTIALIKEFKQIGIIAQARPLLDECRRNRFWLNDRLVSQTLQELGDE